MERRLTVYILIGMVAGVLAGYVLHQQLAGDASQAAAWADGLKMLPDIFLRLIKMLIAPLVFATIVVGIAQMGDTTTLGRIGLRALVWFLCASVVSLGIGMLLVNVFQPGHDLALAANPDARPAMATIPGVREFILKVFPTSIVEALSTNNVLQIVVFALFAGVSLSALGERGELIVRVCEQLAELMLHITGYVMRFAPLAVFGALAAVIISQGLGILLTFGKLVSEFYVGLLLLWLVLIGVGLVFLRQRVWSLLGTIREPFLLAFATASSEAALPKLFDRLDRFGVPRRLSGFILPLGYSFNLDGSMMYMSFATLFIAQAYHVDLSWQKQLAILLTLMVTSKGIAAVPRASLVVVTATLASFGLPVEGVALILGIDQIMDMGRTATNVVGNSIATASIARIEGMLRDPQPGDGK